MRSATLRDVALLAGVSARTVSNVVNGYAPVTEGTRRKVEHALSQLDYRPNVLARNLANGRSGQIAVVVPHLDTAYFSELLRGIIPRARRLGYSVLVDQTDGDAEHERELVRRGARGFLYDGMILSPLGLAREALADRDPTLPLVVLGEHSCGGTFDHVGVDDVTAAREATAHLLGLGRRRIAAIGDLPPTAGEADRPRTRGYRRAHEDAGIAADDSLLAGAPRADRADGARAMEHLLGRADPPDAVLCSSDLVALGALHAVRERGLRVPEDVALIGYGDIEEGRYSTPTLSTVSPDKAAIAATAVDRLLRRIDSDEVLPGIEVQTAHRLVVRESSGGRPG